MFGLSLKINKHPSGPKATMKYISNFRMLTPNVARTIHQNVQMKGIKSITGKANQEQLFSY